MALRSPEREVMPEVLLAEDLHAGDEVLFDRGDFGNGARFGGLEDEGRWREDEARFHALYLDVLAGRRRLEDPELVAVSHALGIHRPRQHDRRPPRHAEVEIADEVLADATEDSAPDALYFVERITGDDAPPTVGVLAALAFVGCAHDGRRPVDFWAEDERDRPIARAAWVVERVPPMVFVDGVPLLPLSARLTPTGPAPEGPVVARAYPVGERWAWSGVVRLPAVPDPGPLVRRLDLELLRVRRWERRATWEDMLRRRPEVVYRAAHEGARRTLLDRSPVRT